MEDLLIKELSNLIELAKETTTSGILFLHQEIPEVITQLLYWKMTMSLIMFFIAVFLFYVAFRGFKKSSRLECEELAFWTALGSFLTLVIGFSVILLRGLSWLQILIAPKIYLIEYSMKLLGK